MAGNHLKPGDFMNTSSQLLSENGRYRMVFGHISKNDASGFNYLQICNTDYDYIFEIWIANPNQPISDNSSVFLTVDHSGELKITRQGGEPIILYSSPQATNNTLATLLDNGNFVLQELHSNGSTKRLLWQSFDYPSDILLPGMKLGVNHKTGHSWSLSSWLTNGDPSSASSFTLEWDYKDGELIIRKRELIHWKSGVLNRKTKRFENIPEEAQNGYVYTIVSNEDEDYFSFQTQSGDKEFAYWALLFNGDLNDGNDNFLAMASNCYGYNTDGGCQRWNLPGCRHKGDASSSGPFIQAEAGFRYFVLNRFEVENKAQEQTTRDAMLDLVTFYGPEDANELSKENNGRDIKAWDLWKQGVGLKMLDPSINNSFIPDQVLRCIHIALLCTQECPVDRPPMSDVLSMLTNENAVLPLPNRPAFYFRRRGNVATEYLEKSKTVPENEFSISDLQAR
ncbi:hypothetical protein L6164_022845 [Bauhinia variegata]|uniref:Uncharacterized protein n=1 Tax=Bauhinia variegata TaxID=167791 RepID=A0ACB9MHX7_BAUVA|nr:hypothetical protein L6164_022845 [Bauhinia variegata]